MASENEEIIRNAYRVAEEKDLEGWVNCFTPDGTFTDQSIGVTYQGPKELPFTVQNYAAAFPDMHREPFRFYEHGKIKRFDCYPSATIVMTQLGILENLSAHIEY